MNIDDCRKFEPVFNAWYVKSVLGHGSFGSVFEIQKEEFGKVYKSALKVISIPQSDDEIERMRLDGTSEDSIKRYFDNVIQDIISEMVIMSELKGNSNIVSLEDHAVIRHGDDIGYDILIRMELLTPLMKYRAEHGITANDVVRLGIDLCRGLELCEKNNIIHRDIKPENIFVAKSGNYKLGDFGIARTIEKTSSELSRKGTYSYMSPEIYRGQNYGQTVDIYSLGLVMYAMLNGTRTPFLPPLPADITHNDKERSINRRLAGEPLPVIEGVDRRLMDVILRACAYKSEDRYQNASEMRRALEQLIDYDKTEVLPVEPVEYMSYAAPRQTNPPYEDNPTEELPADNAKHNAPAGVYPEGAYPGSRISGTFPGSRMDSRYQGGAYPGGQAGSGYPGGWGYEAEKGKKKRTILIAALSIVLVAALAVCGAIILKKYSDNKKSDKASTKKTEQKSDKKEKKTEPVYISPKQVRIYSWDVDYSNSVKENSNNTFSYNIIMLVKNNSDKAITGLAYKTKNSAGNYLKNLDTKVNSKKDPFYAEGYIEPSRSGIMVSNITVSENEFNSEDPHQGNNRLMHRKARVTDVYAYRGDAGYKAPTGSLHQEDKVGVDKYGNGLYNYDVSITNPNSTPIHKGALIVAAYKFFNDAGNEEIKISSANGMVNEEIKANENGYVTDGMVNTELGQDKYQQRNNGEPILIKDYDVRVIDGVYSDGSLYKKEYYDKYGVK